MLLSKAPAFQFHPSHSRGIGWVGVKALFSRQPVGTVTGGQEMTEITWPPGWYDLVPLDGLEPSHQARGQCSVSSERQGQSCTPQPISANPFGRQLLTR